MGQETKMYKLTRKISNFMGSQNRTSKANTSEQIIEISPLKALYIPIPKVACSSIKRVIAELLEIEVPSNGRYIHRANLPLVNREFLGKYDNYLKFCFVRNPWDRLVSCYSEKIKPDKSFFGTTNSFENGVHKSLIKYQRFEANMSFEDFLKAVASIPDCEADQHFRSQYTFLIDKDERIIANFIGKFESIDKDFQDIFKKLGKPEIQLPKSNRTHHAKYRSYYTGDLLSIFNKRYSKDIDLFDYNF